MSVPDNRLTLVGEGVKLRPPRQGDYEAWAEVRGGSRAFLQPWEPSWPADDLTRGAWRRRLSAYGKERDNGEAWRFLIFRDGDNQIVGGVSLSNVRRGVAQSGTVGYWAGADFTRRGHTLAGVSAVVEFAFATLNLHRLEAACVPDNEPSARLLLKAGFREEGFVRKYLKINGVWRDHRLFGLVCDDDRPGAVNGTALRSA